MQSSLGGAIRAFVLLACLIVAPLMALPDISFPAWLKKIADGHWNGSWWGERKAGPDSHSPQAKPSKSLSQRDGRTSSSLFGGLPADLRQAAIASSSKGNVPPLGETTGPAAGPASRGGLTATSVPWTSSDRGALLPPRGEGLSRSQGVIPTAFVEQAGPRRVSDAEGAVPAGPLPVARQEPAKSLAGAASPSQSAPQASPEQLARFRAVEDRLRALGAVHYLLEVWGNAAECYRFRCRMPLAGSAAAVRHFEATDSDGLAAMSKVLADVEAWKARSL